MTSSRETVLCQYHYDPLDRLISVALPDIHARQRFYCKSRLVTEMQGAMRCSIVQQGDQLLAQQQHGGDAPGTTLLASDQQRSVLKVLKGGHPPLPIAYSPYGHRPVESRLLSLLGFNGERPDSVTGHYLLGNGYRAFNPVLMRFNSPDSWSPFGKGGLNAYAYCEGDPTNFSDPTGHGLLSVFSKIFGSRKTARLAHPHALSVPDVNAPGGLRKNSAASLGVRPQPQEIVGAEDLLSGNSSIITPPLQDRSSTSPTHTNPPPDPNPIPDTHTSSARRVLKERELREFDMIMSIEENSMKVSDIRANYDHLEKEQLRFRGMRPDNTPS